MSTLRTIYPLGQPKVDFDRLDTAIHGGSVDLGDGYGTQSVSALLEGDTLFIKGAQLGQTTQTPWQTSTAGQLNMHQSQYVPEIVFGNPGLGVAAVGGTNLAVNPGHIVVDGVTYGVAQPAGAFLSLTYQSAVGPYPGDRAMVYAYEQNGDGYIGSVIVSGFPFSPNYDALNYTLLLTAEAFFTAELGGNATAAFAATAQYAHMYFTVPDAQRGYQPLAYLQLPAATISQANVMPMQASMIPLELGGALGARKKFWGQIPVPGGWRVLTGSLTLGLNGAGTNDYAGFISGTNLTTYVEPDVFQGQNALYELTTDSFTFFIAGNGGLYAGGTPLSAGWNSHTATKGQILLGQNGYNARQNAVPCGTVEYTTGWVELIEPTQLFNGSLAPAPTFFPNNGVCSIGYGVGRIGVSTTVPINVVGDLNWDNTPFTILSGHAACKGPDVAEFNNNADMNYLLKFNNKTSLTPMSFTNIGFQRAMGAFSALLDIEGADSISVGLCNLNNCSFTDINLTQWAVDNNQTYPYLAVNNDINHSKNKANMCKMQNCTVSGNCTYPFDFEGSGLLIEHCQFGPWNRAPYGVNTKSFTVHFTSGQGNNPGAVGIPSSVAQINYGNDIIIRNSLFTNTNPDGSTGTGRPGGWGFGSITFDCEGIQGPALVQNCQIYNNTFNNLWCYGMGIISLFPGLSTVPGVSEATTQNVDILNNTFLNCAGACLSVAPAAPHYQDAYYSGTVKNVVVAGNSVVNYQNQSGPDSYPQFHLAATTPTFILPPIAIQGSTTGDGYVQNIEVFNNDFSQSGMVPFSTLGGDNQKSAIYLDQYTNNCTVLESNNFFPDGSASDYISNNSNTNRVTITNANLSVLLTK